MRRRVLPLLDNDNGTADGLKFKQAIYDLHQSLDAINFEVTRKNVNERISLRSVCINPDHFKVDGRSGMGRSSRWTGCRAVQSRLPSRLCAPTGEIPAHARTI